MDRRKSVTMVNSYVECKIVITDLSSETAMQIKGYSTLRYAYPYFPYTLTHSHPPIIDLMRRLLLKCRFNKWQSLNS